VLTLVLLFKLVSFRLVFSVPSQEIGDWDIKPYSINSVATPHPHHRDAVHTGGLLLHMSHVAWSVLPVG